MSNTQVWATIAAGVQRRNAAIDRERRTGSLTAWSYGLAGVAPVGGVNAAKDIVEFRNDPVGNGLTIAGGSIQMSSAYASLFVQGSESISRRLGYFAVVGGTSSLLGDAYKARLQLTSSGRIEAPTLWSLASDLGAILSAGGFLAISAAVAAGATTVALPVIGTVSIATALTLAATAGVVSTAASAAAAIAPSTGQPTAEQLASIQQLASAAKSSELFNDPNAIKAIANLMVGPPLNDWDIDIISKAVGVVAVGGLPTDAAPVPAAGLGTSMRNSAGYLSPVSSESVAIISGGTISDLWLVERNGGNVFTLEDFGKAIMVSNPEITNINVIKAGQVIYVPKINADGSTTYPLSNGARINSNAANGEYHMVVPNTDGQGGQTIYSRVADEFGYTVKQVSTNAAGEITFSSVGWQETRQSEVNNLSVYRRAGEVVFDGATLIDGKLVEFNAQYDAAREQFRASEIRSINGQALNPEATPALDTTDLHALLDPARPWTPTATALITGLDPAAQTANGWAPPQLTVTPLDNGLTERRLTLGNGVELASVRDDDRRVLRVILQRDDTDSTGAARRTITTENRNADGSTRGPVQDDVLRSPDSGDSWLRQSSTLRTDSTDPETGERITHENRTTYASDGHSVTGREDTSSRHDAGGQLHSSQRTVYEGNAQQFSRQETTTRQADNSLRTDIRDGQGQLTGRRQTWTFDDGTTLESDIGADGHGSLRSKDAAGDEIAVLPVVHDGGIEGTTGTATVNLGDKPVTLRVDFGNGELYGIEQIDGRAPLNAPLVNAAAQDSGITVHDLAMGRGTAPVRQLAEAAPKPCAARCRRSPHRAARHRKHYSFHS